MAADPARAGGVPPGGGVPTPVPAPLPSSGSTAQTPVDVPPNDFLDLQPRGDLSVRKYTLRFRDPADEDSYRMYRWQLQQRQVQLTLLLLIGLAAAFSFEYEIQNYEQHSEMLLILFIGRIVPLAVLCVTSCLALPWVARYWSPLAAGLWAVVLGSVYLMAHLCANVDDLSTVSNQCVLLGADSLMPWLPVALQACAPLLLIVGLCCTWYDTFLACLAAFGLWLGLVMVGAGRDFYATALLTVLAPLLIAAVAGYVRDSEIRGAFRREVAVRRKLLSLVSSSLSRIVQQEQPQRLVEVLKRTDVVLMEVSASGVIHYVSPAVRALLGLEPDDLLRMDSFRFVHPEDIPGVRDVYRKLTGGGGGGPGAAGSGGGAGGAASRPAAPGALTGTAAGGDASSSYSRLQVRMRRHDGSYVWVELEAHPVVRRPTVVPGVSAPLPQGETTILLLEKDVTVERRKAAQAAAAAAAAAASAAAAPVATPVSLQVPGGATISTASTSISPALTLSASGDAAAAAAAAAAGAVLASRATPAAADALGATAGAPTFVPVYDPYFERTMYTALAGLHVPLSGAQASAAVARAMARMATDTAASSATLPAEDSALVPSNGAGAAVTLPQQAWTRQLETVQGVERLVQAVADQVANVQLYVADALGIARFKCQHFPLRPTAGVPIRQLAELSALLAQQRLAASPATARVRVTLEVDERVPSAVATDPVRVQQVLDLSLGVAVSSARTGDINVSVQVASATLNTQTASATSASAAGTHAAVHAGAGAVGDAGGGQGGGGNGPNLEPVLRCTVSFDAASIGGVEAVAAALGLDPLVAEGMFTPVAKDASEPAGTLLRYADVAPRMASHTVLLPLLRHVTLCMGGAISAGTGDDSQSSSVATGAGSTSVLPGGGAHGASGASAPQSHTVILVVDLPFQPVPRPMLAGPSLPDLVIVRSVIANAPVDYVPTPGYTIPLPMPLAMPAAAAAVAAAAGAAAALQAGGGARAGVPRPALAGAAAAPVATVAAGGAPAAEGGAADGGAAATAAGARARGPTPETQGMHVLFVDDEHVNRRLGARMLQRLGCTFQLLEDGDQVAECLRSSPQPFSVVLMDIVMQRTDGAAVCQELRDNGVLLPIVAMTGNTSQKDVQRFMAAGFDLVLPKPFDIKAMGRALVEGRVRRARHNAQMGLTGGGVGAPAQ